MLSDIAEELAARIKAMRAQNDEEYDVLNVSAASSPTIPQRFSLIDTQSYIDQLYGDACDDDNKERLARSRLEAQIEAIQNRAQFLQRSVVLP